MSVVYYCQEFFLLLLLSVLTIIASTQFVEAELASRSILFLLNFFNCCVEHVTTQQSLPALHYPRAWKHIPPISLLCPQFREEIRRS
jgi:hypothetical protein